LGGPTITALRQIIALPLFIAGLAFMWIGVFFSWLSAGMGMAATWY
jgi:hypothetical protein